MLDAAGKSVDAVVAEQADIGFVDIDPIRGAAIACSAPYLLMEGFYLVTADSPLQSHDEVDRPENRVVLGKGSAYDFYLTRTLKQARSVGSPTSLTVADTFLKAGAEIAAGVKQRLEADAGWHGGLRLRNERFMVIQRAMGVPKTRGEAAATFLRQFVEDMKQSADWFHQNFLHMVDKNAKSHTMQLRYALFFSQTTFPGARAVRLSNNNPHQPIRCLF